MKGVIFFSVSKFRKWIQKLLQADLKNLKIFFKIYAVFLESYSEIYSKPPRIITFF